MKDQAQDRRAVIGRAADIGGVTAEKLAKPRVAELAPKLAGHGAKAAHRPQNPGPGQKMPRKAGRRGRGGLHDRDIEGFEQRPGAGSEGAELALGAGTGKGADLGRAPVGIVIEVQRAAVGPEMPGQARFPRQRHVVREPLSGGREKIVEHVGQRQDRRARIHGARGARHLTHLAAGRGRGFADSHPVPRGRKAQGRRKAADAGPDHDDFRSLPGHSVIVDSTHHVVHYDLQYV